MDFLHKSSLVLLKNNESIMNIGDIKIQKIINKYTDKNINSKSNKGMIKSFYMNSLGIYKNILMYKGVKYNKLINFVSEVNTSKTCSCCGWKNNNLKLSDRVFTCIECNNSIDRDYNSAVNMKLVGSTSFMINKTCSVTIN